MSHKDDDIAYAALGCCFGAGLFYKGLRDLRLERAIANLPTSKARSLAMGPVELIGTAAQLTTLTDPIYRQACAYYRIDVEEQRGSGKSAHWANIYHADSDAMPLLLVDDTGQIPIHPQGAELYCKAIKRRSSWLGNMFSEVDESVAVFFGSIPGRTTSTLRLTAYIIREKEPLCVLGYAAQNDLIVAAAKAYPAVIRKNPNGFFVISDESKRELVSSLESEAALYIFGGPVLAIGCAAYLAWRLKLLGV